MLGQMACIKAQTYNHYSSERSGQRNYDQCRYCDGERSLEVTDIPKMDCRNLFITITNLLTLPAMQKTVRPRVTAMRSLKRILSHTDNNDHLNVKASTAGQWCLQSLKSSLRDLRIAAGYVQDPHTDSKYADMSCKSNHHCLFRKPFQH